MHALQRIRVGVNGGVAILAAVTIVGILGLAGFAVDLGSAYAQRARLQKVADSAAMAGALSWIKSSHSATAAQATIQSVVTANGWPASAILNPSNAYLTQSPKHAANPAIQVQLSANLSLTLLKVIAPSATLTTGAYAVAEIVGSGSALMPACILSLTNLIVDSNMTISASNCSVVANQANSNQAILLNSNATLNAKTVDTPGGIFVNSNANLNTTSGIYTGSYGVTTNSNTHITGTKYTSGSSVADPFSSDPSPSSGFSSCQNYNRQTVLTPGCYQNVNLDGAVSLKPGTYYIQGSMNMHSNASLSGTGVTVVLQNQFSQGSNTTITLSAPTSSSTSTPYPGVAIYAMGGMNINSNSVVSLNGALYSPTQRVVMNSNTNNANNCTYVIANSIELNSNATLSVSGCSSGYPLPNAPGGVGVSTVALVK